MPASETQDTPSFIDDFHTMSSFGATPEAESTDKQPLTMTLRYAAGSTLGLKIRDSVSNTMKLAINTAY